MVQQEKNKALEDTKGREGTVICHADASVKGDITCIAVVLKTVDQREITAFVMKFKNDNVHKGEALGIYHALIQANVRRYAIVHVYNDNSGVVEHCAGKSKFKTFLKSNQRPEYDKVRALAKKTDKDEAKVHFHHVVREQNVTANQIVEWGRKNSDISFDEVVHCIGEEVVQEIIQTYREDAPWNPSNPSTQS